MGSKEPTTDHTEVLTHYLPIVIVSLLFLCQKTQMTPTGIGKSAPKIRLEQNPKRINFLTGRSFWFKWTVLNLDFIIPSKNQQVPFLDVKILVFKSLWHHHVEAQICSFSQEGFLSVKCMCSDRRLLMKCRLINLLLWMQANS